MTKFLTQDNLAKFLNILKKDYEVYVPVKKDNQRFYKSYDTFTENIQIGEVRPFEPLKAFFIRARERVVDDFNPDVPLLGRKPYAIVGVKNCDLKGFRVQDYVFKDHDYKDPFYIRNREENLIISVDCTFAIETCFCIALGNQPYPESNFDINLSPVKDGFVVESGSQKGEKLITEQASYFEEAEKGLLDERDKQRARVIAEVEENIKENEIPRSPSYEGIIEKNYDSEIWNDEAKTCVECGACTIICPACHCFLLYDQMSEKEMARFRIWDSCMLKDYAKVAGGANPRPKLWMRLRNRFEKKFDFFPKLAGIFGCTGCGRCISACPAKIDIRKVLGRLVAGARE